MWRNSFCKYLLLALLLVFASTVPAEESPDMASALVRDSSERMLDVLEARRGDLDADHGLIYELVGEILVPSFDFERITSYAMGQHWRKASASQKQQLMEQFKQLLVRTYAKALLNYSGQEIKYLPLRPGRRPGQITVRTEVNEPGAVSIPINYQLHIRDGAWKVYDVVIDSVSLVANYRSSFNAQIRRGGIDGLIETLRKRNQGSSS